jgi:hypothetical protein
MMRDVVRRGHVMRTRLGGAKSESCRRHNSNHDHDDALKSLHPTLDALQ